MPLISPTEGRAFDLPGVRFTALAAPSVGATENAVWIVAVAPGTASVPHRLTREETLVAIEGAACATLAGVEYELTAGAAFVVPANTDFLLSNPHNSPFRAVVVLPVGGQAVLGGAPPFTPPWAE